MPLVGKLFVMRTLGKLVSTALIGFGAAAPSGPAWGQTRTPESVFAGSYFCQQGSTPLTLTIMGAARGTVKAKFNFTVPQTGEPGSYLMYGMIRPGGETTLYPERWLVQPRGFMMVGLSGNISSDGRDLSGLVLATGCRQFNLRLTGGEARLAAQAPRPMAPPAATAPTARVAMPAPTAPVPAPSPVAASRPANPAAPAAAAAAPATLAATISDVTMPGVLIRELDEVNQQANPYAKLGEMLGIPKMAKINDADGTWFLRNMDGSSGLYDFDVQNVRCQFAKGNSQSQTCTYEVSAFVEMMLPIVGRQAGRSPFIKRTDTFTRSGGRWISTSLRAAMLSGMKAPPGGATAGSDPSTRLCRALGAGVAATVASKESVATYRAAGC